MGGLADTDDKIYVRGRVYTFSRHYLSKRPDAKIATNAQIRYVMLESSRFERQGDRREVYEGYVPELAINLRVVIDRLNTGEYQILTVYPVE